MANYLVIGLGRFGRSVAKTLYGSNQDVLALDIDEELVQQDQVLLSLINDFSENEENQALIESMRLLLRGGHDE